VTVIAREPLEIVTEPSPAQEFPWPRAWFFVLLATIGAVLTLPYSLEILDQLSLRSGMRRPGPPALAFNVLFAGLLAFAPVAVGLKLGQPLGLSWPPLRTPRGASQRFRAVGGALIRSAALGVASALAVLGSSKMVTFPDDGVLTMPSWSSALLGSFGAGIREEIWFRFGLLTLILWGLAKLTRDKAPNRGAFWTANVLAALAFGAIHLPQAAMIGTVTATVVAWVLMANGIVGLACGWLYWRQGIAAAMVCHGCADVVLKVIMPLLSPGAG
jgi:hypothetical protein